MARWSILICWYSSQSSARFQMAGKTGLSNEVYKLQSVARNIFVGVSKFSLIQLMLGSDFGHRNVHQKHNIFVLHLSSVKIFDNFSIVVSAELDNSRIQVLESCVEFSDRSVSSKSCRRQRRCTCWSQSFSIEVKETRSLSPQPLAGILFWVEQDRPEVKMYKLLLPVRDYLKLEPVRTDNFVFRLHSQATFVILVI